MRILVEPSDYRTHNIGDLSLLMVAVSRLGTVFPEATIEVFSDEPEKLRAFCPQVTPLPTAGRELWLRDEFLPARVNALLRRLSETTRLSGDLAERIRRIDPAMVDWLWRRKVRARAGALRELNIFTESVARADLMVVAGMGGVTDAFPDFAKGILETVNLAMRRGVPVAMMGQGIGPLTDPVLHARARSVLPRVGLIAVREERASVPLLRSLGVPSGRIVTTGDDAIELAYRPEQRELANGLGVNIRLAGYSQVSELDLERLRRVLRQAADSWDARLVPVPIATLTSESDASAIATVLTGSSNVLHSRRPAASPADIVDLVRLCRVVVTGSYHAGVFALSCGVPAIGIAKSQYYVEKFCGLAAQFGPGCEVATLDDPDFERVLPEKIDRLWTSAEQFRPGLLQSAARQIALGQAAYGRLREIVTARRKAAPR